MMELVVDGHRRQKRVVETLLLVTGSWQARDALIVVKEREL